MGSEEKTESVIKKEIMDLLLVHPRVAIVWQTDAPTTLSRKFKANRYHPKGIPDIIGVLKDGKSLLIEVKTEKGKVREEQETLLEAASQAGALAFICRSREECLEVLGRL